MKETQAHWVERDLAHVWHPCSQMKDYEAMPPIVIDHGKGVYLYDLDGKEYIDVISSWWCNLFGHCHPAISRSLKEQADRLEHVLLANFTHRGVVELCEQLTEVVPPGLTRYCFADCGSAAVECALKMAFQYMYQTGRPEKTHFFCLTDSYHGETLGALSVGSMDEYAKMYRPLMIDHYRIEAPDCYRCPYGRDRSDCACECFERAEKAFREHAGETCAVIVEPLVQGSAGMRMYPPEYLRKLRTLCDEAEVLLIADEIATGFGRTGQMFACGHAAITPDIMCVSKGLTGGYLPMAIAITTEEIYRAFYADYSEGKAFMHSHTYSGNALGCAVALAVLKLFREQPVLAEANRRAEYLNTRLKEALGNHPNLGEIRNMGLLHAVELVKNPATREAFPAEKRLGFAIYRQALERGLMLRPLGDVLYFNPPLVIREHEIDQAVARCREAILAVLPA